MMNEEMEGGDTMVLTIFTDKDAMLVRAALDFYHEALVDDRSDDPEHARGDEIDALEELNYRFPFIQEMTSDA